MRSTDGSGDEDDYLRTGDILEIAGDDRQYLRYVDRSKDMVVRGGMKISAAELEGSSPAIRRWPTWPWWPTRTRRSASVPAPSWCPARTRP